MTPELREQLGHMVRETWIEWAKEQPNPKASWLVEWGGLSEPDKEVDRRIGARIWEEAIAAEREACAKVIDNEIAEIEAMFYSERYRWEDDIPYLKQLAAKIRARSEGGEG